MWYTHIELTSWASSSQACFVLESTSIAYTKNPKMCVFFSFLWSVYQQLDNMPVALYCYSPQLWFWTTFKLNNFHSTNEFSFRLKDPMRCNREWYFIAINYSCYYITNTDKILGIFPPGLLLLNCIMLR